MVGTVVVVVVVVVVVLDTTLVKGKRGFLGTTPGKNGREVGKLKVLFGGGVEVIFGTSVEVRKNGFLKNGKRVIDGGILNGGSGRIMGFSVDVLTILVVLNVVGRVVGIAFWVVRVVVGALRVVVVVLRIVIGALIVGLR